MKDKTETKVPQSFAPLVDRSMGKEAAEAIAGVFGITLREVRKNSKRPQVVTPRFAIAYVLHCCNKLSLSAVGRIIGRNHSTVAYACTQFRNWLDTVPMTTSMLARCQQAASQVLDRGMISMPQVSNKPARNKTPKTTNPLGKEEKQGEKLTTYKQNNRDSPLSLLYIYKNKKGVTKGETVEYSLPERLDNPDFFKVWNEWLDHRRDIKKPLTQNMVKAQLKMMNREGAAVAMETMQQSMEQGWTGLFPEKITGGKNNARIKNIKNINAGYNKGDGSAYEDKARARGAEEVGEAFSL
jgi:hypothetical protein